MSSRSVRKHLRLIDEVPAVKDGWVCKVEHLGAEWPCDSCSYQREYREEDHHQLCCVSAEEPRRLRVKDAVLP